MLRVCVHSYIRLLRLFIQISERKKWSSYSLTAHQNKIVVPSSIAQINYHCVFIFHFQLAQKCDIFWQYLYACSIHALYYNKCVYRKRRKKHKEISSVVKVRIVNIFVLFAWKTMLSKGILKDQKRDSCYIIYLFVCPSNISVSLWQQKLPLILV